MKELNWVEFFYHTFTHTHTHTHTHTNLEEVQRFLSSMITSKVTTPLLWTGIPWLRSWVDYCTMPLDNVIFPGKSKVVTFFHIENFYIIMSYCFHFAQTLLLFLLYVLLGLIQLCHNKKEFLSFLIGKRFLFVWKICFPFLQCLFVIC